MIILIFEFLKSLYGSIHIKEIILTTMTIVKNLKHSIQKSDPKKQQLTKGKIVIKRQK